MMTPPTLAAGGAGLVLGSRTSIDSRVHWIGGLLDGILRGSRESENAGYRVPQIIPAVSFAIGAPPAPADSLDKIHASAGGAPMLSPLPELACANPPCKPISPACRECTRKAKK